MSTNILVESHNVSKNALKKAAKEKEKAEKKAQKQQEHPAKEEAADTARHLYGALDYQNPPPSSLFVENLRSLELNSRVTIEAEVETSRVQSAKLAFLVLRKKNQSIQVVVAEGGEQGISRQMVKFCGNLSNSFPVIRATGVVKAPKDAIKSTTISHLELHLESIYTITQAFEQRPVQVEDMSQPPPEEEESPPNAPKEGEESAPNAPNEGEESAQTDHSEGESPEEVSKKPNVSLKKRLDYKVITLQVPANEAIMNLLGEVYRLFHEYMFQHKFRPIFPSYLTGAATEGGAEVFEVKYFEREAFLTQSPQFHKQMAIAGRMQRVFTVGPVFRAENSNTTRHLTEVRCSTPSIHNQKSNQHRSSPVSTTK